MKKGRRHGVLLFLHGLVPEQIGLKLFSQCHDDRSIRVCIPHGSLPVAPFHDMPGRNRKGALLLLQANTILSTCFCRIFYFLPIQELLLLFSKNKSIAIPPDDTGYLPFWVTCKENNSHIIHRHIFFAGPKPF